MRGLICLVLVGGSVVYAHQIGWLRGSFTPIVILRAVLDSLRCRYPDRYLFLDGPAIKGSPDARILSELADFVVLVAGYGRDTPAAIAQAAAAFDPNRFAGVVFNQLP